MIIDKFPKITKEEAQRIEQELRFERNIRKTIEINGQYYDIRKMTDKEADMAWYELIMKK